jgi:Fe-S cluster biogenesis protein NfuA
MSQPVPLTIASRRLHRLIMYIETETTPNPATLKFLPGCEVMAAGTREFTSDEEAAASPLAEALLSLGDVSGVFFGRDFVSVTAGPGTDWSMLKPQVASILLDHFISGAPLFANDGAGAIAVPAEDDEFTADPADADIVAQIRELIETRVRPAVAGDGGDIIYRGFREGVVYLTMQGACSGCPSSTATLKNGIESLLKHYVPEVSEVRAA